MRPGAFAMILATICLPACEFHWSPDACVDSFPQPLRALNTDPPGRVGLRYAFELRSPDPALQRNGIEGVTPSVVHLVGGPGAAAAEAERIMNRTKPTTVYIVAEPSSWLVYAPVRRFSAAEGRRHLAAMCALSSRGLSLRRFSVALPDGPK